MVNSRLSSTRSNAGDGKKLPRSGVNLRSERDDHHNATPMQRLGALLITDKRDLGILVVYTVITSLVSLAVPLAAQALVNTIAAGIFLQPLIVLSLIVLFGLLFGSVVRMLKFCIVENLQQRIFANITLRLSERIPAIKSSALNSEYMPELINRFFDVVTIQKSWSKLLLEVPTAALQVVLGLVIMAFYSPLLLAFDVIIILFIVFAVSVLGIGGLRTSIRESVLKYRVAEWLEDMGRCQSSLKTNGITHFLARRSDGLVINYLRARGDHFAVLFRQALGTYLFQALASAGILAIGGWLVINRQLTLGQLVAAELIVLNVLSALEKLIRNCDTFYDLLTGLDKVGHITDLPIERSTGIELPHAQEGLRIECLKLHFSYDSTREILSEIDLEVESGQRASLVGASGAGKTTLASLVCGLQEPSHGTVEINGFDVRDLSLLSLRHQVGFVGDINEIFEGTIEENVGLGRPTVSHRDIRWALDAAQFTEDLVVLPNGINTMLVSGGRNLSRGQVQRLLIARAIAGRPNLLILDEAFTGIDEKTKLKIIDALFEKENRWTVFDISHDAEVVMRSDKVYVLSNRRISESGSPTDLAWRDQSEFSRLFPELARQIRSVERRKKERVESK